MHASCICGKVAGGPEESSRSKEKRRAGFPGSVSGGGSGRPLLSEAGSLGWGWAGAGASMGYAAGFPFVSRPPRRRQVPASSMRHRTGGGNRMQGAGPAPLGSGYSASLSIRVRCWDPRQGAGLCASAAAVLSLTGGQTLTPVMVKTEARPASRVGARGGQPVLAAGLRPLCSECGPWSCLQ